MLNCRACNKKEDKPCEKRAEIDKEQQGPAARPKSDREGRVARKEMKQRKAVQAFRYYGSLYPKDMLPAI